MLCIHAYTIYVHTNCTYIRIYIFLKKKTRLNTIFSSHIHTCYQGLLNTTTSLWDNWKSMSKKKPVLSQEEEEARLESLYTNQFYDEGTPCQG